MTPGGDETSGAKLGRSNEDWRVALADDGDAGESARRDLRALLVGGLRRALASRGVAEDLCEDFAQEAMLRIRERLASFRGEARFTTWALSIAIRIAFDELRHRRWRDVSYDEVTADAKVPLVFEPSAHPSPDRDLVRERVLACLRAVLETETGDPTDVGAKWLGDPTDVGAKWGDREIRPTLALSG